MKAPMKRPMEHNDYDFRDVPARKAAFSEMLERMRKLAKDMWPEVEYLADLQECGCKRIPELDTNLEVVWEWPDGNVFTLPTDGYCARVHVSEEGVRIYMHRLVFEKDSWYSCNDLNERSLQAPEAR